MAAAASKPSACTRFDLRSSRAAAPQREKDEPHFQKVALQAFAPFGASLGRCIEFGRDDGFGGVGFSRGLPRRFGDLLMASTRNVVWDEQQCMGCSIVPQPTTSLPTEGDAIRDRDMPRCSR